MADVGIKGRVHKEEWKSLKQCKDQAQMNSYMMGLYSKGI